MGGRGRQELRRRVDGRDAAAQGLSDAGRVLLEAVGGGGGVGQGQLPGLLQDIDALAHVAEVQRVLEAPHDVPAHLRDLEHLGELLDVPGDEVQEREALKVLGLLVAELHDLVVALAEGLDAQLVPGLLVVQGLGGLERHLDVAALDREVEARALVLDEVQRHLGEALLLQVGDDRLPRELRVADHGQDLVELALDERELEHVLGGVDLELGALAVAVQAVDHVAKHLGDVHGHVEGADDARVSVGEAVLDVVEGGVDEDAVVVPGRRLDPDGLVDRARLPSFLSAMTMACLDSRATWVISAFQTTYLM